MNMIKNIKKNTIVLLLITLIVLFFVLKDNLNDTINAFNSMDLRFILIAIIFFFISIFLKALVNYITVNDKKKITLLEAFKHNTITQFFNGITPFSTGGQPMEIYMLTEHDLSLEEATNISIQNFIFYQIALVLFGVIAVGYNFFFHIFPKTVLLRELVLLGFLINTFVAIGLVAILISKSITKKISRLAINILSKIKIIKDKESTIKKLDERLDKFHECAKILRKRKGLLISGVAINFMSLACQYIIPLFIIFSLHDYSSISAIETITASAYVLLIGSFVPIPGASGGIEFGFMQFFGNFLVASKLSAVLIVWRFITYYLGMICGALAFSLEKKVK